MLLPQFPPTLIPPPVGEGLNPNPLRANSLFHRGRAGVGEAPSFSNQQVDKQQADIKV
ncbi:MAG: hypothetical protein FD121_1303 [Gallionellaceae bacterium]|nr:MAG: hypothetical protein FD121_1303 [Gallionellaceae bacterium]